MIAGALECRIRNDLDQLHRWRRFVAVATVDDPKGCQVVAACPPTDLGSVIVALADHVLSEFLPDDVRELAAASLLEGAQQAVARLAGAFPAMVEELWRD